MSTIDKNVAKSQPINIKFENGGEFCDLCGHRIENPKRNCCKDVATNGWKPTDDTRYFVYAFT